MPKIISAPKFSLTESQTQKYIQWRMSLPKKDFGTIGGGYEFIFTPTGLGNLVKVRRDDGHELDLTETENF